jgi:hypothetical protein
VGGPLLVGQGFCLIGVQQIVSAGFGASSHSIDGWLGVTLHGCRDLDLPYVMFGIPTTVGSFPTESQPYVERTMPSYQPASGTEYYHTLTRLLKLLGLVALGPGKAY